MRLSFSGEEELEQRRREGFLAVVVRGGGGGKSGEKWRGIWKEEEKAIVGKIMDCYRLGMNERKVVGIGATYVITYDRVF